MCTFQVENIFWNRMHERATAPAAMQKWRCLFRCLFFVLSRVQGVYKECKGPGLAGELRPSFSLSHPVAQHSHGGSAAGDDGRAEEEDQHHPVHGRLPVVQVVVVRALGPATILDVVVHQTCKNDATLCELQTRVGS